MSGHLPYVGNGLTGSLQLLAYGLTPEATASGSSLLRRRIQYRGFSKSVIILARDKVRQLIFRMVAENTTWGAPRIHGELLMLGFDISERTVSRWMKQAPRDSEPAKRWRAFLKNHREAIAAMDFFTVPTITFGVLYCFEPEMRAVPMIIIEECLQDCLQIIERISEWCDGKLPADRTRLVALILERFARRENVPADIFSRLTPQEWQESQACFAMALVAACDIFTRDRNAQFLNF
jgi:hypothetical protein